MNAHDELVEAVAEAMYGKPSGAWPPYEHLERSVKEVWRREARAGLAVVAERLPDDLPPHGPYESGLNTALRKVRALLTGDEK